MSKLIVEVVKIEKVIKHPNADRLSIALVKGWNCIIGLDQQKAGDLVIFCPIDSIIPEDIIEKYKLEYLKGHGRVITVKLRKCISQGLILEIPKGKKWKEGKDVAKELGITKYEPKAPSYQHYATKPTKRKMNPAFDKYTDIDNIKNYKQIFKEEDTVVVTEKIHGTNFRAGLLSRYKGNLWGKIKSFLFGKYEFVYGSHNVQLKRSTAKGNFYGEDIYGRMAKKYKLAEVIPEDYIVYGEIYGKGIQDLEYGKKEIDIVFFDVKHKGKYLDWKAFKLFCTLSELPIVPVLGIEGYGEDTIPTHTEGKSLLCSTQVREGCVIKPLIEENHYRIGRKILKSINSTYLLRKGGTEYK